MHIPGAGLTNMIFMKPGGVVVETVGIWDGRMLPVCGSFYFKTKFFFVPLILSFACRIHGRSLRLYRAPPLYILYYYDWENRKRLLTNPHLNVLQPSKLARESFNFYSQVRAISSITK